MNDETESSKDKERPEREAEEQDEGSFFDKMRKDTFKRKVESKLKEGVFKNIVSELKMPREIVTHLISQIDETKQAALGVISREVRLFLENTNLADEMTRVLSQLSFEVTTRVRFVPNEKRADHVKKQREEDDDAGAVDQSATDQED
jgi:hypothetical protein